MSQENNIENTQENSVETIKPALSGYAMLRQLCSFKANKTAFKPTTDPISNRVEFITAKLRQHSVPYHLDKFIPTFRTPNAVAGQPALVNIVVEIEGVDKTQTTIFIAHHDVANMNSENCQDNSASVCNLLDLTFQLKNTETKPNNNVAIVFTDAEETCSIPSSGAARLCKNIWEGLYHKVKYVVNSELTAQGDNYWMSYGKPNLLSDTINTLHPDKVKKVMTPFSDSVTVSEFGIDTVCLGILDEENMKYVDYIGYCPTWGLCHSKDDSFILSARENDMNNYVIFLKSLV